MEIIHEKKTVSKKKFQQSEILVFRAFALLNLTFESGTSVQFSDLYAQYQQNLVERCLGEYLVSKKRFSALIKESFPEKSQKIKRGFKNGLILENVGLINKSFTKSNFAQYFPELNVDEIFCIR